MSTKKAAKQKSKAAVRSKLKTNGTTASARERRSRRKYPRHFLKEVIARVDFSPENELDGIADPTLFPKGHRRRFPTSQKKTLTEQQIAVSHNQGQEPKTATTHRQTVQWQFLSRHGDSAITLARNFLSISYSKYETFERLLDDFLPVVDERLSGDEYTVTRVGLRYIDQIELDETKPTEWGKYLAPAVLGAFPLADEPKTLARVFHVVDFTYGNMDMRFQFGMPNPDFPAPIKKKQFVLDWDAYCESPLSPEDVSGQLHQFHEKIKASFEEVITDALRKKMGFKNE